MKSSIEICFVFFAGWHDLLLTPPSFVFMPLKCSFIFDMLFLGNKNYFTTRSFLFTFSEYFGFFCRICQYYTRYFDRNLTFIFSLKTVERNSRLVPTLVTDELQIERNAPGDWERSVWQAFRFICQFSEIMWYESAFSVMWMPWRVSTSTYWKKCMERFVRIFNFLFHSSSFNI